MKILGHLLIVAPHPDDEVLAVGATMHDHARRGGTAEIIAVTDGEAADKLATPAARHELAARRSAERAAALERLGAGMFPVVRLGFPDGGVAEAQDQLELALTEIFERARRDHGTCSVFLPWCGDPHPDHKATGRAGSRAALAVGLPRVEVPIWGWYHAQTRADLPPDRLRRVLVSAEAQVAKRAALDCFASQLELLPGGHGPVLPADFLAAFDHEFEPMLA